MLNFIHGIRIATGVAFCTGLSSSPMTHPHHPLRSKAKQCPLRCWDGRTCWWLSIGNIIDAEAVECVGDSRLAWFLLRSSLDVVANQMSSMGLRGTIVYAPPGNLSLPPSVKPRKSIYLKAIEGVFCEMCGRICNRKPDQEKAMPTVNGILLLEMFMRFCTTNDTFKDNLTFIVMWQHLCLNECGKLQTTFCFKKETNTSLALAFWKYGLSQKYLVMVNDIGVACSSKVSGRRMSISRVANQLPSTWEKFFALGLYG